MIAQRSDVHKRKERPESEINNNGKTKGEHKANDTDT